MSLNGLLVDKCDVYQRTTTIGQYGNAIDTYTLLYQGIKCRSMHKVKQFGSFAGQINTQSTHALYVDKQYTLDTSMRVILQDGVTYQINHADAKFDGKGIHHVYYEMIAIESPETGA